MIQYYKHWRERERDSYFSPLAPGSFKRFLTHGNMKMENRSGLFLQKSGTNSEIIMGRLQQQRGLTVEPPSLQRRLQAGDAILLPVSGKYAGPSRGEEILLNLLLLSLLSCP